MNLSQFATGQDRFLFLRCRVDGKTPEVAHARISYTDELNDGAVKSADGVARVNFTADRSVSEKSVNGLVEAQKLLVLTAVAKDEAIAQADAGNYQQAATILQAQSAALDRVFLAAPASVQSQISAETNNLEDMSGAIGGFGGGASGSGSGRPDCAVWRPQRSQLGLPD